MEDLSPLNGTRRLALTILNSGGLQDHRFLGQAVLPGVLALEHLARAVRRAFPDASPAVMEAVRFEKLLALPDARILAVDAVVDLTPAPGGIEAALMTRHVAAKSGMARLKVHARARFCPAAAAERDPPSQARRRDPAAESFPVSAERLYADLVPFGPAFRNVASTVHLWPDGAAADVAGGPPMPEPPILGSPYPLDAAFHAACAWAQRYAGIVAFPVAAARRVIRRPTRPGEHYEACVRFRGREGAGLIFDLGLRSKTGFRCESIGGLLMRDVSGGRLRPPAWIRAR